MKKKVLYKLLIVFVVIAIATLLLSNVVFGGTINTNGVVIGRRLINEAAPVGNRIVGVIKVVGIFVSVAMTMIVGMRYMLSSVEEKAEYKKTAIIYLIGAILIFSTTQLIDFIYNMMN